MKSINRRDWLRIAGLGTAATALNAIPGPALARTTLFPGRPIAPDGIVRLSSNENPYGPSPKVRETMRDSFDWACRYPYAYQNELLKAIAAKEGVPEDHIILTGGSTEGLKVAGLTYGLYGKEIIAADPTFLALMSYAEQFGAHIHSVPVDKDMGHDLEAMEKRICGNTGLIFICNPNNPTGTLLPANDLRNFCRQAAARTLVFVDEAYFEYITEPNYPSMIELVKEGLNVIVSRTFSKVFGLAGVRMGYLIARPDIAERLMANRVAFVSTIGLAAAKAALDDQEFYRFSLQKNTEAKKHLYGLFDSMGLKYTPSHTNFVFFHTGRDIRQVMAAMDKQGVQVGRPFPPFNDWCRISTGTMEEMDRFGQALRKVMA
ncbi:MAG: aminotransferase class I/II-fold pyridoxal phosphate-dependent enzyme [Lewinellaceae bacterium]|nr:aminotransferase class I/II-fold pyridoxal phosphate-dependent enzyme [Lewinellaceae bacterium]